MNCIVPPACAKPLGRCVQAGDSVVDKTVKIEHSRQRKARPAKPLEQERKKKKIMKALGTLLLFICFHLTVFGTAQEPDKLIYNGKEYSLHSNPMEKYFEKFPDKRPQGKGKVQVVSSSLWRGYIATFEIKDNQLYLKDIEIEVVKKVKKDYEYSWKSVLKKVFPNKDLVKIDWLTGLLVLPKGEIVNYVHMGYASTYEHYVLLEFENGNLKGEKQFGYEEYEKFKEKQFQAFKKTDEYEKLKEDLKKEGDNSDVFIEDFLRIFVIDYSSKILVEE